MIAGRYSLKNEVGRGGMGVVWRGEDVVLGRDVALKRIGTRPGDAAPDLARAEREARLAASLNHPHVVSVFDLVEEPDARWLVMEYVESRTLAELVKENGPLAPDTAARILWQAADALAAAHSAGIVHRDVKPSNILVTPTGQAKLTDFGIARAYADATLTQTGLVTGSPAYLAPEVAMGEAATAATDVWSFGATLFHALTGRPPYEINENLIAALYQIVHEEPPRPTNAGWLLPLFEHTLTRDPADRWSMDQVRRFLAREAPVESGGPATLVIPPRRTRRVSRPVADVAPRRHRRIPLLLAMAVTTAAVVAAAVLVLQALGDRSGDQDRARDSQPTATRSSAGAEPPARPRTQATAAGMRAFAQDYLATAPSDPAAAWERLTPGFQNASGGFGGYRGFWSTIASATPKTVDANPETMTVRYSVHYEKVDGSSFDDLVVLKLTMKDGDYLIAGEPTR